MNGIKKIVFDNIVVKFYENLSIYPIVLDNTEFQARDEVGEIGLTIRNNTGFRVDVRYKTAMDCMFIQKR